jgi:hypothetical protein
MNQEDLTRSQAEQLELFKEMLKDKHYPREGYVFNEVIGWVRNFPKSLKMFEREYVRMLVCESFRMTQEELDAEIINVKIKQKPNTHANDNATAIKLEQELGALLPTEGLLKDYVTYTSRSEAPLAYHVFSFLCAVGTVLNRRLWFDMGYYRMYPTLGIIILGPSGIKKTSAANIAVDILQTLGVVKIYSEKLTPEALIEAMKGDNAVGLVYAPEMAVFLNKQQYNEGLVQLITRFMDCPDVWESGTIGRGKSVVRNIGISSLMCSTIDWFVGSTPADSFGGGFIARNLLVVQELSARCEPIPNPGDTGLRQYLVDSLAGIHELQGEVKFSRRGFELYDNWYRFDHTNEVKNLDHDLLATYHNRKPDHLKRIAICLHVIQHGDMELCDRCFQSAINLLNWTEQFLPSMLQQMFRSQVGEAHDLVLRFIRNEQPITHSNLVRKTSHRMNAAELKTVILSLKEARIVKEMVDNVGHYYTIMEEK